MGKVLKPILYWSLIDVLIALIFGILTMNLLVYSKDISAAKVAFVGFVLLGLSSLSKLIFAGLSKN